MHITDPYKRPMTKEGFFPKYEYVYDEMYDCYICPSNRKVLEYSTTNEDGYREYKSNLATAETARIFQSVHSRDHQKVVQRHVWEDYMERCEDIRHTLGMEEELYQREKKPSKGLRNEEFHGLRYTNMVGKARMRMKVGLTFTRA